jgi:hypothetical protein
VTWKPAANGMLTSSTFPEVAGGQSHSDS